MLDRAVTRRGCRSGILGCIFSPHTARGDEAEEERSAQMSQLWHRKSRPRRRTPHAAPGRPRPARRRGYKPVARPWLTCHSPALAKLQPIRRRVSARLRSPATGERRRRRNRKPVVRKGSGLVSSSSSSSVVAAAVGSIDGVWGWN